MNIGALSSASGIQAKLIRHYESIGLIPRAKRNESGYRQYTDNDVHTLQFIKRARGLGFSLTEIKKLVGLWQNKNRASQDVKSLALTHLGRLESRIHEMQAMADTLRHLVHCCQGNSRPDCPILDDLSTTEPSPQERGSAETAMKKGKTASHTSGAVPGRSSSNQIQANSIRRI